MAIKSTNQSQFDTNYFIMYRKPNLFPKSIKPIYSYSNKRFYHLSNNEEIDKNKFENIYDIVIVGGGIVGNALACALATKSHRIAHIESNELSSSVIKSWNAQDNLFSNRVSSLTPKSVKFFKDIGVWDHVDKKRIKGFKQMQVWDGISGARIKFDSNKRDGIRSIIDSFISSGKNYNIQNAILTRLDQCKSGNFKLFEKTKVEDIYFDDNNDKDNNEYAPYDLHDWPNIKLNDGKILKARLLVGADGINSIVRSFANIESIGWDYNSNAVVATLHIDSQVDNSTAWQRFLPTGPIAMLPIKKGFSSMVWSTTPSLASKFCSLPSSDLVHLINSAFRLRVADLDYFYSQIKKDDDDVKMDYASEFSWRLGVERDSINTTDGWPPMVIDIQEKSCARFPLRMRNSENYVKERIVLIGDAAHTIHPLAGQGLNQGLADVESLFKVIKQGVMSGQDIGSLQLLQDYSSERYLSNLLMIGAVDKLHKLFSTDFTPIVWARSIGLESLNGLEHLKAEIMKFAMGVE
nr:3424_t:CDS:10 [Entrophospora candida]